jgi:type IV pilus assembly protein PilA
MFCAKCGAEVQAGKQFCNRCGTQMSAPMAAASVGPVAATPIGPGRSSGKAVGSLITGIVGLIFFPVSIAAIILGHMSRSEIRKSNGGLEGSGMALAGLIMGYLGIAFLPLVLIVAAIAIPNLLRARMAQNEESAVAAVRRIVMVEGGYRTAYPSVGYTCNLASLGGDRHGAASSEHAALIDERLASGEKSGYRYVLQNCVNADDGGKFQVVAYPMIRNQSGVRAFCSDESGVIKVNASGSGEDCLANGRPLE